MYRWFSIAFVFFPFNVANYVPSFTVHPIVSITFNVFCYSSSAAKLQLDCNFIFNAVTIELIKRCINMGKRMGMGIVVFTHLY